MTATVTAFARSTAGSLPPVLLVEDNPYDALLVREAYAAHGRYWLRHNERPPQN